METWGVTWQAAGGRVRLVDDIIDSSLAATQKMVVAFLGRGGFSLIIAVKGGKKSRKTKIRLRIRSLFPIRGKRCLERKDSPQLQQLDHEVVTRLCQWEKLRRCGLEHAVTSVAAEFLR